jgi:hypothetical protein
VLQLPCMGWEKGLVSSACASIYGVKLVLCECVWLVAIDVVCNLDWLLFEEKSWCAQKFGALRNNHHYLYLIASLPLWPSHIIDIKKKQYWPPACNYSSLIHLNTKSVAQISGYAQHTTNSRDGYIKKDVAIKLVN